MLNEGQGEAPAEEAPAEEAPAEGAPAEEAPAGALEEEQGWGVGCIIFVFIIDTKK